MKNFTKLLAVVLAFAMALSMVSFAAFTDVAEDNDYNEAVTVLSGIGIINGYEDGSFKPEATITRAEFAAVVIRMLGLADSASGGAELFTDVAADHWANGVIALAAQQGIVNGYGDGRFGPEDPVKYQEAIKMVVAALGYTPMADANGGYPGGHKVVASQKGILAGVKGAKDNEAASRGIVAQLAYNALTVPLMEQTGYGTQTNFETVGSLLLNKLGIVKFEGKVTATSLSDKDVKDGEVKVKYTKQFTGVKGEPLAKKYSVPSDKTNPYVESATAKLEATGEVEAAAKALLDVASVLYVKDADTDDAVLVAIAKDGNKNESITFPVEDVKKVGDDVVEVWTDEDAGEYEEYDINITKVYLNGREKSVDVKDYLKKSLGVDFTLLSTEEEDVYDIAYITEWADYKVTRIADRTFKVTVDKLGASGSTTIIMDEEDEDLKFEIYKDGKAATFADIEEDDVLSIAGYINGDKELEYGKVYIISDKVEGNVTAKAAGKVSIDGTVYKTTLTTGFNLGDTAVFYKNIRGILVAVDTTATAANVKYGFASYVRAYDADYGEAAQIRLLTTDGVWETLAVADKVSVDGAAKKATKEIPSLGLTTKATGSNTKYVVNALVAYDLNAEGEVAKIYFKADKADIFYNESISGKMKYDADTVMFGDVFMDDATVIYSVNGAAGTDGLIDEDDITVVALASIADAAEHTITAGYDYDDNGVIGCLVGANIAAGIDYKANFFVVSDDSMESTNEAGDAGLLITGIQAGEEVTLFVNSEDDVKIKKAVYTDDSKSIADQLATTVKAEDIAKGDVILYTLNANGEVDEIAVLVDASDIAKDKLAFIAAGDDDTIVAEVDLGSTTYKFAFGYAVDFLDNGNITLAAADEATTKTYAFASDAIGTMYDKFTGKGKVYEAMSGDITTDSDANKAVNDGDMVFARIVGSRISEFVAIANGANK